MFKKKLGKVKIKEDNFVDLEEYNEDDDLESEILDIINSKEGEKEEFKLEKKDNIKIFKNNLLDKLKLSKFIKFKNKGSSDFVDVGEPVSYQSNFVIVADNKNKFKNIKYIFKVTISIILFISATVIVTGFLLFKIIPGKVVGSNYRFANFSLISRDYQPNLDELNAGDTVICADKAFNFLPFLSKYEEYKFESRNGSIIFTKDKNGNMAKIQSVSINYILKE